MHAPYTFRDLVADCALMLVAVALFLAAGWAVCAAG